MEQNYSPGPWKALRWWEGVGMTLDDAMDEEEREDWINAPIKIIESADGKNVCNCYDMATIKDADAKLIEAAPAMDLILKLLTLGLARIERSSCGFSEFCL